MVRINLKGATRAWAGSALKNQRFLNARNRDETPYERQNRIMKMNNPNEVLKAWIGARTKRIYPRTASLYQGRLTIGLNDLDAEDIAFVMKLVFITVDGAELKLTNIGSDTYTEGSGRWEDDPESTYSMVKLTFS